MPGTDIPRSGPVARRLRQLGAEATGPVLYVADGAGAELDVLAHAVREAGRNLPVVACSRRPVEGAVDPEPVVRVAGTPEDELRTLPMRFGAVVIHPGSGESLERELGALAGRLMPRAPVLVLDSRGPGTPSGGGDLEVREHAGSITLLMERDHAPGRVRERGTTRHEAAAPGDVAALREHELETLAASLSEAGEAEAALAGELARRRGAAPGTEAEVPVTVVIVVHDGYEALAGSLDGVVANTPAPHRILLVDDASGDERIAPLLDEAGRGSERVTVLSCRERRGPVAAAALGCDRAAGDVLLLESGCEVAPGWLEALRGVARSRPDVATVTAVSDLELTARGSVLEMAELVARLSERRRPPAAPGRGRCLYLRREALDRLGPYDGEAFQRRAGAAALANLTDDATFVGRTVPAKRRRAAADDGLAPLRDAVAAARRGRRGGVAGPGERPAILLVLHAGDGGTPATNRDLARSLAASFRCLTLACDLDHWTLTETRPEGEATLERIEFTARWALREPLDDERTAAVRAIVEREGVVLVHLRSMIASGPELIGAARALGVPVVCSLHDFFAVCPTIQLLDEHEIFSAGHCTAGPGPCPTSARWVGPQPDLKHGYVHEWRGRMAEQLDVADAFVTTSDSAKRVLVDHFGFMDDGRFRVIEHGRDAHGFRPVGRPPGERPRVVVFGALGVAKGISLLEKLLELDRAEGPHFEFHFLGEHHRRLEPVALGGIDHGPYGREELPARLAEIGPSYALIPSIWPETYCHTLTEAWMAGLPVFASDIGTLRERIGRHGGGWLLDHTDPAAFYAGMCAARERAGEWHLRRTEIAHIEPRTVDDMAADYRALYRELLPARAA